ncbi:MAG TPA: DUF4364 family protein [Clostridia bacterium]|nr:DUF4364 family protein [Clostridia bacterium]
MQKTNIPIDKLILLYVAKQAPGIRRSQLRDAALATLSMDYFDVTRALDELIASHLLYVAVRKDEPVFDAHGQAVERCELTDEGRLALDALEKQIPASTKRFLSTYLSEGDLKRRLADTVTATVDMTATGNYRLTCHQREEDDAGLTLSLSFPTQALAQRAAATWRERAADIYLCVIDALLPSQDKDEKTR